MKAMKTTLGLLAALVAIAIIILLVVLGNLNTLIEQTVATVGSQVTKTQVQLDDADASLIEGRIALSGFSVANPAGFSDDNPILAMQQLILHTDIGTLTDKVKVVKELTIDGIKLIAEHKNIRDTNIEAIIDNITRSAAVAERGAAEQETAVQTDGEDTRLMVEKLTFANSSVALVTEKWGEHSLELPGFSATQLGDRAQGLTPPQLIDEILSIYLQAAKERVKDEVKQLATSKLKDKYREKYKDKYEKQKANLLDKLGIGG